MTADQRIAAADDLTSAEQRVRANIERVAHQSGWSLGTLHADFDAYVAAVKQAVDAAYTGEAARWEDAVETVRQGRASAAYRVQRVRDAFRVVPEAGTPTGEPPRNIAGVVVCGECREPIDDDPHVRRADGVKCHERCLPATGEPDATEGPTPAAPTVEPPCTCPFAVVVDGKVSAEERASTYHVWKYLAEQLAAHLIAVVGLDVVRRAHGTARRDQWLAEREEQAVPYRNTPWAMGTPTVEPPEPAPGPKRPEYEPRTEAQRLGYLIEECGEVLAAAGKSLRWGYDSTNPELPPDERETNAAWLRRELGDLREAISRVLPDLEAHR